MKNSFTAAAAFIGLISMSGCNQQPKTITTIYVGEATACLRDGNEFVLGVLQETTFKSKGESEAAHEEILSLVNEYKDDVENALQEKLQDKKFSDLDDDRLITDLRPSMKGKYNIFASKVKRIPGIEIIEIKHMEVTEVGVVENGCSSGDIPHPSQTSI
jgi:hypothetical protein